MRVHDVMTEHALACKPDSNLAEAGSLMWEADCGALPVVDSGGGIIGVITDRDIAIAVATRNRLASDILVKDVMSKTPVVCGADDDINTALKLMRREKVRRLPVVSQLGVLRGIISLNDVVLHGEKFDGHRTTDLSYEDVVGTMKAISEHRHPKAEKVPSRAKAASA
jgi:CBS domain-containing protein